MSQNYNLFSQITVTKDVFQQEVNTIFFPKYRHHFVLGHPTYICYWIIKYLNYKYYLIKKRKENRHKLWLSCIVIPFNFCYSTILNWVTNWLTFWLKISNIKFLYMYVCMYIAAGSNSINYHQLLLVLLPTIIIERTTTDRIYLFIFKVCFV